MIIERPVLELIQLETFESGVWTPWLADAQSVSINRGGQKNGASATVDVGTMTCTLVNAGDPMVSSALKPNLPIRVITVAPEPTIPVPEVPVYSTSFESGLDGWTLAGDTAISNATDRYHTGSRSMALTSVLTDTDTQRAVRTITGLTSGRSYTFRAWSKDLMVGRYARIGVTGKTWSTYLYPTYDGPWIQHTYTFTATATSHQLVVESGGSYLSSQSRWDDIELVETATTMPNPAYAPPVPIFTGRIVDLDSVYAVDKTTGKKTTYVTVVAVDAVNTHANTIRYGAVTAGGVGYETWAQRIIRLSTSAVTPVDAPVDDAPIVRYGLG